MYTMMKKKTFSLAPLDSLWVLVDHQTEKRYLSGGVCIVDDNRRQRVIIVNGHLHMACLHTYLFILFILTCLCLMAEGHFVDLTLKN